MSTPVNNALSGINKPKQATGQPSIVPPMATQAPARVSFNSIASTTLGERADGSCPGKSRDGAAAFKPQATGKSPWPFLARFLRRIRLPGGSFLRGSADKHRVSTVLRQLALLLEVGIPLTRALRVLFEQEEDPRLRTAFEKIRQQVVNRGISLPDAFAEFSWIFPDDIILLLRVGDARGKLSEQMVRGAELLERQHRFSANVKQAITGPLITMSACLLFICAVVKFIVPRFLQLYSGMQVSFPVFSQGVILFIRVINHPLMLFTAAFLVALVFKKRRTIRDRLFRWSLQCLPLKAFVGKMLGKQWCETVAFLYRGGIPIQQALHLLAKSCANPVHAENLRRATRELISSGSLPLAVSCIPYFPRLIKRMLVIGETSGELNTLLTAASRIMDEEIQYSLSKAVMLIEPIAIILLGAIMSLLFVGLFLPIYHLAGML